MDDPIDFPFCDDLSIALFGAMIRSMKIAELLQSLADARVGGSVIDVLVRPDISFDTLRSGAVEGKLQVSIASIDDLIGMKRIPVGMFLWTLRVQLPQERHKLRSRPVAWKR